MLFDTPLLIMSVHTQTNTHIDWLTIQNNFINQHTTNFTHSVCLINYHRAVTTDINVVANIQSDLSGGDQHLQGLQILCDHARSKSDNYRAFLVLDSDCFPICSWENNLLKNMRLYRKNIACIVRPENFDLFAHPAAVYTTDPKLLNFGNKLTINTLGQRVCDNLCLIDDFMPLLRTNKHNIHPIAYGIYYDSLYHHGAGSRNAVFRSDGYYNKPYVDCDLQFSYDPQQFIKRLV